MSVRVAKAAPDADRLVPELDALLDRVASSLPHGERGVDRAAWRAALLDPARDILGRAGKGVRCRMLHHGWELGGGSPAGPPAALPLVIELLHAGSLIIDDIEDDSRERRGQPALHREVGVPLALNTGNWMYFLAADQLRETELPPAVRLSLHEELAAALLRCHEGQALDLSTEVATLHRADVRRVVETATRLKTGSLMSLAACLGARAAGADDRTSDAIARFGTELGVGLQMLDDWSGLSVDARRDKGIEDIKLGRPTWPWAWLAGAGDELAYAETARQARELSIDWEADQVVRRLSLHLKSIAPAAIRSQLDAALVALAEALGPSPALESVRSDVEALAEAFS